MMASVFALSLGQLVVVVHDVCHTDDFWECLMLAQPCCGIHHGHSSLIAGELQESQVQKELWSANQERLLCLPCPTTSSSIDSDFETSGSYCTSCGGS